MIPSLPFDCRLIEARPLTPAVREMVFERTDGAPFLFEPGQWVNLVLPVPEGEIKRAYSIASPPVPGSPRFELAVTRVTGGPGSTYLHDLAPGQTLRAIGPQGLFTRGKLADEPSLFIATGTGITPFRSMIADALARRSSAP
ncbi:MAG: FAD-binding oxidoreductase, partial [Byssovorax sp.]